MDLRLHGLRHLLQRYVASLVSITVVVVLEVIHVDQQDRERTPVIDRLLPEAEQLFVEYATVLRAGERIVLGELRDEAALEKTAARLSFDLPRGHRTHDGSDDEEYARAQQHGCRQVEEDRR